MDTLVSRQVSVSKHTVMKAELQMRAHKSLEYQR